MPDFISFFYFSFISLSFFVMVRLKCKTSALWLSYIFSSQNGDLKTTFPSRTATGCNKMNKVGEWELKVGSDSWVGSRKSEQAQSFPLKKIQV